MALELKRGQDAIQRNASVAEMVQVNAGGPYSANALREVMAEADQVWRRVLRQEVAGDWITATMEVHGSPTEEWSVRVDDGPLQRTHAFQPLASRPTPPPLPKDENSDGAPCPAAAPTQ
eukprot:EG_transcript_31156